jgi:hypothetical protein
VIAQINDANGNETLKLASIASAVNEVTIENAAAGNAVHISASGGDASVGLHLAGKGASGYVNVQDSTDATKRIMFNAAGGTTNTRTMLSSTQTVDRTLSLPDATDTLVGKATTDTLTNKTLTSPTITGGALNGTLGSTTPSTVAATTLTTNAVGAWTSSSSGATTPTITTTGTGSTNPALLISAPSVTTPFTWYIGGAGANGSLFIYDGAANRLTLTSTGINSTAIGATTPSTGAFSTLSATGLINGAVGAYFPSITGAPSGSNLEIGYDSGNNIGVLQAYNRTGSAWRAIGMYGLTSNHYASGSLIGSFSSTGLAVTGAGSFTGLLTTSAGITNTTTSIKSTLTYGPVYEATENNTDNVGRGIFNFIRGTTTVGQIVTTNTTCAYNNVSDYRLKNITGPVVDSGTFIDALKPKVGTWKSDGSKFVGFLAHEFAEVSPVSVTGEKDAVDADGKAVYQSMQASTSEVIANLVAELQSLRKRLAALESK